MTAGNSNSSQGVMLGSGHSQGSGDDQQLEAGWDTFANITDVIVHSDVALGTAPFAYNGVRRLAAANVAGGQLVLAGGRGYGLENVGGLPGAVIFKTGDPASAGDTLTPHVLTERWRVEAVKAGNGGGHFLPGATATYDIGTSALRVKSFHAMNFQAPAATQSSSAPAVDLATSDTHAVTLTGSGALSLSNIKDGASVQISVVQGGAGSFTLTWPSTVKWVSATAPTLSTAVGARDMFTFYSDGTNLYEVARRLDVR
jgi:hypothetical protein